MSGFAARLTVIAGLVCVGSLIPAGGALAAPPACTGSSHVAVNGVVQFPAHPCTDPEGDPLTYSVVDWPTGGSLVGNTSTGQATYTALGGTTDDSFTFRAHDGTAFSNTATMTISVPPPDPGANHPPACPNSSLFVAPGVPTTVHGNCSDPEGDPLSYAPGFPATGGALSFSPPATATYTSNPGTLSDSFGYTATDTFHPPVAATVFITVTSGNVFETAPEATAGTPFVASVESPAGGPVLVDARAVTAPPPDGFLLLSQEFDIEAPPASVEDPLRLVFKIDGSAAPAGTIDVFRDIATNPDPIPDCDPGAGGQASPDPCVLSRVGGPPDDVEVTVLSSHASRWNFAVGTPYDFSGFFAPVNNQPALNSANAGRAIPVKFSLNGDMGLDILAPGYPRSQAVDCAANALVDGIESTVTPGSSALSYDAGSTDTRTCGRRTSRGEGCRQLVVKLTDGSKHRANFRFR